MPTLLADTNLFLWVDLEKPSAEEAKMVLEDIFHFHPLSIEDCVMVSPSPKVEEYSPKEDDMFATYLFMVIHAVDYSRRDVVSFSRRSQAGQFGFDPCRSRRSKVGQFEPKSRWSKGWVILESGSARGPGSAGSKVRT